MRRLIMLSLALGACGGACSQAAVPPPVAVRPGMTEQQVVEASHHRLPDRIVERVCGNETPAPFSCKVYVYDGAWREGRYQPKLSVVFEQVQGRWLVSQWL
jgi:hypothetical protein